MWSEGEENEKGGGGKGKEKGRKGGGNETEK